jgi:hypothetical protein
MSKANASALKEQPGDMPTRAGAVVRGTPSPAGLDPGSMRFAGQAVASVFEQATFPLASGPAVQQFIARQESGPFALMRPMQEQQGQGGGGAG